MPAPARIVCGFVIYWAADVAAVSGAVRAFFLSFLLDVLAGPFFVGVDVFDASARFSAQRFLVASLIALRPAALSFLFAFGASG